MKINNIGKTLLLSLALFLFASPLKVFANITMFGNEKIEPSRSKMPQSLTWSDSFQQTEGGLELRKKNEFDTSKFWIQSNEIPFGSTWRPPTSSAIFLSVFGNTDSKFWDNSSIYYRYSTDKVHWSSWMHADYLTKDDKTFDFWATLNSDDVRQDAPLYNLGISIPSVARTKYSELHKIWIKSEEYTDNEHLYCNWLAKNYPTVFEKEIPVIGYIQFRIEGSVYGLEPKTKLKSFNLSYMYSVSGLGYFDPIDKENKSTTRNEKSESTNQPSDGKWHFDLNN